LHDTSFCAYVFWATVCKTVRPMLSVRCLSVCPVLSVTLVFCGQTVRRIKLKLDKQVGLCLGHIVLDGYPAPHPHSKRGTARQFSAHVRCGKTAGWIKMPLGMGVGLGPCDFVLYGDPAPPPQKGGHSPNFRLMSIMAKRLDESRCHLVRR